jgi:hypothetical protein
MLVVDQFELLMSLLQLTLNSFTPLKSLPFILLLTNFVIIITHDVRLLSSRTFISVCEIYDQSAVLRVFEELASLLY